MTGMNRATGRLIGLEAHLAQSIHDILSTPRGSRVLRREYGSDLPDLIDAPMNPTTMIDVFAATADALARWEPRFVLRRVEIAPSGSGAMPLVLIGEANGGGVVVRAEVGA